MFLDRRLPILGADERQLSLLKVLLVEDNKVDAGFVRGLLRSADQNVQCEHIHSLAQALALLGSRDFHVVLLDLNLEDSSGYQTFARLKTGANGAAILVLSGSDDEELAIRTVREGAQDYLVKGSFDGRLLLRSVRYAWERKRAEDALRKSEATVRAVFEGSLDGIAIVDDDGICLESNSAAAALLGLTKDELHGTDIFSFSADTFARQWRNLRECGSGRGQFWIRRPGDGARRLLDCCFNANILPGSHLAVLRDITEQHNLEEQLRQSQKMEAVGRLAGGVAHDFNNILGVISGYAELLQLSANQDSLRNKAEKILTATEKASSLTRQLLAFGRRQVMKPTLLSVPSVVAELSSMITALMGAETQIVVEVSGDPGLVKVDQSQLEQVILNLTTNAHEAMPQGGQMRIRIDRYVSSGNGGDVARGEYVRLAISDTGCGMSPEVAARAFEPFFTTKKTGSGLGLSTVYGIVKQSGGHLIVQSTPGEGSTFTVYLPVVATDAAQPARRVLEDGRHFEGSETILLVDDEDQLRGVVAEYLEGCGYRVIQAGNGEEAIALAKDCRSNIALLISDVVMPKANGRAVVDHIRAAHPETAVLVISGYANDTVLQRGFLDSSAFLQKPFTLQLLGSKIRELLDAKAAGAR